VAAQHLTADTSVVVPSLLAWHELHGRAASALKGVRCLPAHALAESFAVLSRLPAPRALRPSMAHRLLDQAFPDEPLTLSPPTHRSVIQRLAKAEVGGGRIYDAIIGATAAEAGVRLLTADRRAMQTYALVGATFELVE
jgi:predicted nucleic acid-binding protein